MSAIRSEILRWARETAGLSLKDAARAIDLKPARGQSGVERLAALENGAEQPPRGILIKMAQAYRRPLIAFYLNAPPKTGDRGQDFRTLPGHERYNPGLDALIRDIKGRQGLIKSMLEDAESEPLGTEIRQSKLQMIRHALCQYWHKSFVGSRLAFDLSAARRD